MTTTLNESQCQKYKDYYTEIDLAYISGAYSIFILDSINVGIILIFILMAMFKHKIYGFNFRLLISLEIGIAVWIVAYAVNFSGIQQLVHSSQNLIEVCLKFRKKQNVYNWLHFISAIVQDVVHWVFAFKYWSLSLKLQIIGENGDPDSINKLLYVLFTVGVLLNVTAGITNCVTFFYP